MVPLLAPIAQLDRALPSEGRGQRFKSSWVRHSFPQHLLYAGKAVRYRLGSGHCSAFWPSMDAGFEPQPLRLEDRALLTHLRSKLASICMRTIARVYGTLPTQPTIAHTE